MDIEIFTVADYAQEQGGKLNILGTFDTITASTFPYSHPQLSIALRIRLNDSEAGTHTFEIRAVTPRATTMFNLKGDLTTKQISGQDWSSSSLAIVVNEAKFEDAGKYPIELYLDSKLQKKLILNVVRLPQKA